MKPKWAEACGFMARFVLTVFVLTGVGSLDGLIHTDISGSKHFSGIPRRKKTELLRLITDLRKFKAMEVWLETQGLPAKYSKR